MTNAWPADRVVGFEDGCTLASDRARVDPIIQGLSALGIPARRVAPAERVWLRVVNRLDPKRMWGNERYRVLNVSDNLLQPPRRGVLRDLDFLVRVRPKLIRALSAFDLIVAASKLQVDTYGSVRPCVQVPDVAIYLAQRDSAMALRPQSKDKVVFAWDGQGGNFPYIESLISNNLDFFRRPEVSIRVITDLVDPIRKRDNRVALENLRVNGQFVPWESDTFMAEVGFAHVGLAPVDTTCHFANAKPDNKAINYLSLGMCAICSATPAYDALAAATDAVRTCTSQSQWERVLAHTVDTRQALAVFAQESFSLVQRGYSKEAIALRWQNILERFHESGPG